MKKKITNLITIAVNIYLTGLILSNRNFMSNYINEKGTINSAFEELLKLPLITNTIPVAGTFVILLSTPFLVIKIIEIIFHVDAVLFKENLFQIYFIISIVLSMLITLTQKQFEFLGSTISFILIFIHFFPKDFANSIKPINSDEKNKVTSSHIKKNPFKRN